MDESIKENIIKVVAVIIIIVLLMFTISANVKYDKLENEVDGYKYEITSLEEKNKEYETLIESYKKSQLEDKAKISEQAETITNLENQVAAKDSKINKLNVEIVTLTKERDKANNIVKTLNEQITVLNTTITTNKTTIEELNTKLATANNKVNTLTTTNESLNNNITNLETKLNSVNKYHVVNSEIELLEAFKSDGNIILNTDIIMSNTVVIKDKYISMDLNGHNLVVTSINLDNTSLEIKDSKAIGKVSLVGDNDDLLKGIKVNETSILKLTNGNYEGKNLIQVEGTLYGANPTFITTQEETINKTETAVVKLYNVPIIVE